MSKQIGKFIEKTKSKISNFNLCTKSDDLMNESSYYQVTKVDVMTPIKSLKNSNKSKTQLFQEVSKNKFTDKSSNCKNSYLYSSDLIYPIQRISKVSSENKYETCDSISSDYNSIHSNAYSNLIYESLDDCSNRLFQISFEESFGYSLHDFQSARSFLFQHKTEQLNEFNCFYSNKNQLLI